jgi:hypothetical protein
MEYGDAQAYMGSWFTQTNKITDHYVLGTTNTYKIHYRINAGTFDGPQKIK